MNIVTTGRIAALCLGLGLPLAGQAQQPSTTAAAVQAPAAATNQARRTQHLTQEQMMQQVEAHLAALRTQLGITPAQEPQWQEFAKVQRDNAIAMRQRFSQRGTQLAQMSAADNMLDYAQITELLAQERMRLATAFRGLYDSMSAEQKQRADVIFRQPPQQQHRRGGTRPS
jgi:protein CpxP